MKVLHTADWHLGKKLDQCEREKEHALFLEWLLKTMSVEKIDVLIIAGDIFDTGSPTNNSLKLYYDFLWKVKNTHCKDVIIIGGNHDSVTTLNAPKELLKYLNVHIVGGVPENPEEQIILLKDSQDSVTLAVCAVPFLRDKDVRLSVSGESAEERETRIKAGIVNHYKKLIPYIAALKENGVLVIGTGHLFAAGSKTSESEKEIHVGNLGQIGGDQFPIEFDYIALGHLHRPQIVNGMNHVRYSGSPIHLCFSENEDIKSVVLIDIGMGKLNSIDTINIPFYRKLLRIKGNLEKVKAQILTVEKDSTEQLPVWIEIQIEVDGFIYDLEEQLNYLISDSKHVEQLFIKQIRLRPLQGISEEIGERISLNDMSPKTVFQKKCESELPEGNYDELMQTFGEALELMMQKEK